MIDNQQVKAIAACVAHEVNRAYCEHLGDDSQPSWADAPDWQRVSAIMGVDAHARLGDVTPAQSHSLWMAHKVAEGWVYGEEKDPEKKTHHCLVPFADLPPEQQLKDKLFGAVVRTILAMIQEERQPPTPALVEDDGSVEDRERAERADRAREANRTPMRKDR